MSHRILLAGVWLLLLVLAAFAGYQQIFSTFAPYDDEGYVMISLVTFMNGQPLYDETFSQYGPAYYFLHGAFHAVTGLPINHDVTRLKTLCQWLLAALACAGFVFRLTRSHAFAIVAFLAAFFHLERLSLEPGHPQEWCALAIALLLLLTTFLQRETGRLVVVLSALLMASLLLTKLNIGGLVAIGFAIAIAAHLPRSTAAGMLAGVSLILAVAATVLLCRSHLMADGGWWPLAIAVGLLIAYARTRESSLPETWHLRSVSLLGAASVATAMVLIGGTLWHGSSLAGIGCGLVTQHATLRDTFFIPLRGDAWCLLLAPVVIALAVLVRRESRLASTLLLASISILLLNAAASYLIQTDSPLTHGLNDRGGGRWLVFGGPLLMWSLFAFPRPSGQSFSRTLLCFVAILLPLSAYPVSGSQVAIGTLPVLLALILVLHDAAQHAPQWQPRLQSAPYYLSGAVLACLVITLGYRGIQFDKYRSSLMPLDLPGATRLRLPPPQVATIRWVSRTVRGHADTFVFAHHGLCAYYFWTELPPPTGMNTTFWPYLLNSEQQERVVAAMANAAQPCIIRQRLTSLQQQSPLTEYIFTNFTRAFQEGDFEIWLPIEGTDAAPIHDQNQSVADVSR